MHSELGVVCSKLSFVYLCMVEQRKETAKEECSEPDLTHAKLTRSKQRFLSGGARSKMKTKHVFCYYQ